MSKILVILLILINFLSAQNVTLKSQHKGNNKGFKKKGIFRKSIRAVDYSNLGIPDTILEPCYYVDYKEGKISFILRASKAEIYSKVKVYKLFNIKNTEVFTKDGRKINLNGDLGYWNDYQKNMQLFDNVVIEMNDKKVGAEISYFKLETDEIKYFDSRKKLVSTKFVKFYINEIELHGYGFLGDFETNIYTIKKDVVTRIDTKDKAPFDNIIIKSESFDFLYNKELAIYSGDPVAKIGDDMLWGGLMEFHLNKKQNYLHVSKGANYRYSGNTTKSVKKPFTISSEFLTINRNSQTAHFTKNVLLKNVDETLNCEDLIIFYDENNSKAKLAIARGNVVYSSKNRSGVGEELVYNFIDKKVKFIGNPVLTMNNDKINADSIDYDTATDNFTATGDISVLIKSKFSKKLAQEIGGMIEKDDDTEPINIKSDKFTYIKKANLLIFDGNAQVTKGLSKLESEKFNLVLKNKDELKRFSALGNVRFSRDGKFIIGDKLDFDKEKNNILVTGKQCKLWQGNNYVSSDQLLFDLDTDKYIARNNVLTYIEKNEKTNQSPVIITSDYLEFNKNLNNILYLGKVKLTNQLNGKLSELLTKRLEINLNKEGNLENFISRGDVNFKQNDISVKCEFAEYFSLGKKLILTGSDECILEDGSHISTPNKAIFYFDKQYYQLVGGLGKKIRTIIYPDPAAKNGDTGEKERKKTKEKKKKAKGKI